MTASPRRGGSRRRHSWVRRAGCDPRDPALHTTRMAYDLCLELVCRREVAEVRAALPDDFKQSFAGWLRRDFANDLPAGDFLWFSSRRGDPPDQALIIGRVRAWLARAGQGPSS